MTTDQLLRLELGIERSHCFDYLGAVLLICSEYTFFFEVSRLGTIVYLFIHARTLTLHTHTPLTPHMSKQIYNYIQV